MNVNTNGDAGQGFFLKPGNKESQFGRGLSKHQKDIDRRAKKRRVICADTLSTHF